METICQNPTGLSRGELLEKMGIGKGDKAGEMSVSNALTALGKSIRCAEKAGSITPPDSGRHLHRGGMAVGRSLPRPTARKRHEMRAVSKTLGPIHFEDLGSQNGSKTFVRQLLYDFRDWQRLEPTGRSGSDDGFDARGFDAVRQSIIIEPQTDDETKMRSHPILIRQWLIQCKRERQITPALLLKHLKSDQRRGASAPIIGIVFVAACDFSKRARDTFKDWCIANKISEYHLWGKADIEDQLFQAKNDHLLFAYFGISLPNSSAISSDRATLSVGHETQNRAHFRCSGNFIEDRSITRPYR